MMKCIRTKNRGSPNSSVQINFNFMIIVQKYGFRDGQRKNLIKGIYLKLRKLYRLYKYNKNSSIIYECATIKVPKGTFIVK